LRTLLELLQRFPQLGDREALRYYNGYRTWTLSYGELYRQIGRLAGQLKEEGIRKGDLLLLWGENAPEWVIAFWSCVVRGAVIVPLDAAFSWKFVHKIQEKTGATFLIHGRDVDASAAALPKLAFDDINRTLDDDACHLEWDAEDASPDDIVQIVYTSGTTGEPRGVVHRHRNLCANLRPFDEEIRKYLKFARPFQPIRILDMLPLSHMFGQSLGLFIPVFLEGAAVFTGQLHPSAVVETIRRERVSVLVAVPRLVEQLRSYMERIGVPAARVRTRGWISIIEKWWRFRKVHSRLGWKFWAFVVGGAQLPSETEEFWERLGFAVITGYGLTEASPVVAVNHPFQRRRGSIGKVLAGQEVRIAPDGEILVRGESIASEYFGETPEPDQSEWLHTGDIGQVDEEGNLRFKGRKKDVIVTAEGLNVYPEDVEAVLNSLPGIREAVVVPQTSNGIEHIHAVLLLDEADAEVEKLIHRANQQLETHQRIRSWSIWDQEDFPRTPSTQKVKRREVAAALAGAEPPSAGDESGKTRLDQLLSEFCGVVGELDDRARLAEDLGLSSLDRIELLARLESSYSIGLDEEEFNDVGTVGELRALLAGGQPTPEGAPATGWQEDPEPGRKIPLSREDDASKRRPIRMPRWNRSWPARAIRQTFQRLVVFPLFHRYIPLTVKGSEILVDLKPPVLFAANHESHLDTIALLAALPVEWRNRIAPAMGTHHFRPFFLGSDYSFGQRVSSAIQYYLACLLVNAYPLPQAMGSVRETLKYTGELVEAGYCPLVFPEGERTPDGTMRPFKPGIGLMAVRLQLEVVPVYLDGLFEVLSLHERWPKIHPVLVKFGKPLRPSSTDEYDQVASKLQRLIEELAREETLS